MTKERKGGKSQEHVRVKRRSHSVGTTVEISFEPVGGKGDVDTDNLLKEIRDQQPLLKKSTKRYGRS